MPCSLEAAKAYKNIEDQFTLYIDVHYMQMQGYKTNGGAKFYGGFTTISGALGEPVHLEIFTNFWTSKSSKSLSHSFSSLMAITSLYLQNRYYALTCTCTCIYLYMEVHSVTVHVANIHK